MVKHADYDNTYTHYRPIGVLMYGKGVCQSFAEAYQLLLHRVGITSRLVEGQGYNGGVWEKHTWNVINIGGNWYHVDVTWNDGSGSNQYFLRSDAYMKRNHSWDPFNCPAAPYDWGEAPEVKIIHGDANDDKAVDILDLVSIIDHIVSGTPCTSMINADANGDEIVDILDLVWIIDKIVAG